MTDAPRTPETDSAEAEADAGNGQVPPMRPGRLLIPLSLSVGVLVIIGFHTLEPDTMGRFWDVLNPRYLFWAVAMVGLRILFGGWRLSFVSRGRLGFRTGIRGQLAWDFAANITPSLIGGAPLAAMYVARDTRVDRGPTLTMGEVTAFMMFVMLLDQTFFAVTALLVLSVAPFMEVIPRSFGGVGLITTVTYLTFFMLWTLLFGYGTLFRPDLLKRLADRIFRLRLLRRYRERVGHEMGEYQGRAAVIRAQKPSFYATGLVLTAFTWTARYLLAVFIVWSVVPDLDPLLAFARSVAMTIGALIMPTPGGAGGVEGLYALFIGPLMPRGFVIPTLLVWRVMAYYVFIAIGVVLTTHQVHKTVRWNRSRNGA